MDMKLLTNDILWITSELCYYMGLLLAVIFIPTLAFMLWMLSIADKVEPNYWYVLIAWVLSVLMFFTGVGIKNLIYLDERSEERSKEGSVEARKDEV
jgi:cobalamin biosynthesis protein CobD/CbiB